MVELFVIQLYLHTSALLFVIMYIRVYIYTGYSVKHVGPL